MRGLNLSEIAVRNPAVTLFLIIAVILSGVFAFGKLGRAEDPSFTVKTMTVTAAWPGATAREMQEQVADRLEKRLQELDFYDRVETIAQPGFVSMKVQFLESTRPGDIQELFYQTRKKLSDEAARLPRGVQGPFFNDEYSDVYFALYALEAKDLPHRELVKMAEDLRQGFLRLPGVKKVNILGEQAQRVFVEFSYQRLATLGIKPEQIFAALAAQNGVSPAGFVETAGPRAYIRIDGAFDTLALIENVPIAAGGKVLRIADVATVSRGYEDPASYRIRHQGDPALMLGVIMEPHFNGLDLDRTLQAEEDRIHADLPLGVSFDKVSDQAKNIRLAVDEFMLKFFVALAVVMLISLLALGFRVGLVVAAAVPLTLSIVFVIMLMTGREFDRITLGALILSLGLLVDDAIIAIEMMVVKLEEGFDRMKAATFAWSSTAAPMLTGTLVTIIGFLPVGFARSGAGEYAGNIFWIVGFALIASWLVAVVFTPYLGVKMLPRIAPVPGGHDALYAGPWYARLRRLVSACVEHRWRVTALVLGAFVLCVLGMGAVKKQFFPNSDRSELILEVYMPPGSAFKATEAVVAQVEKALLEEPQTKMVDAYVGGGAPRFFLSLNPELPDPAFAKLIVQTASAHDRDALKARMRERIAAGEFPSARVRVTQLLFGPPVPFPVVFRVAGPDADVLRGIAEDVRQVVAANALTRDSFLDWGERTSAYRLVLDQDRLRLLGFTPDQVRSQVNALLTGNNVTEVREGTRNVLVIARALDDQRENLGNLADLTLTNAAGQSVALEQVGRFQAVMEDPVLKRRDRDITFEVRADIVDGTQPPDVEMAVWRDLQPLLAQLPAGYRVEIAGPVEESAKANKALAALFPIMILLTLVVIMFQVRSFGVMFMVFATAPLGLIGAVPTLLLFDQPFGFNAILGLIGIGGILMRNTLIFTDQIRQNREAGQEVREAIIEATVRRARPVVLTALAAALAFIPLTLSVFWSSLAFVLIGGVLVGTLLTLLFLPALCTLVLARKPRRPQEDAPMDATRRSGLLLTLLIVLCGLGEISTQMLLPSLAAIEHTLAAGPGSSLVALSVFVGAFGVGQLFFGPLSDRIGRKPVLLAGVATYVLASLWMAFAHSMPEFIAGRALQGLGACAALVVARAIVRDVWREKAGPIMALTVIGMLCTIMLSPVIGGLIATRFGSWRAVVVATVIIGILALLACALLYRESNQARDPLAGRIATLAGNYRALLKGAEVRAFSFAIAGTYGAMFCVIAGSSRVFVGQLGLSPTQYGLVFGGIVSGLIAGAILSNRLILKWGPARLVGMGTALVATGAVLTLAILLATGPSVPGLLLPQVLLTLGAGMVLPGSVAGAVIPNPTRAGLAAGFIGFAQMAGATLSGLLLSALQNDSALPMIGLNVTFALAAFGLFRLARAHQARAVALATD